MLRKPPLTPFKKILTQQDNHQITAHEEEDLYINEYTKVYDGEHRHVFLMSNKK